MYKKDVKAIILFLALMILFYSFFTMLNLNMFSGICYIIGKASLAATLTLVIWCIALEILERI